MSYSPNPQLFELKQKCVSVFNPKNKPNWVNPMAKAMKELGVGGYFTFTSENDTFFTDFGEMLFINGRSENPTDEDYSWLSAKESELLEKWNNEIEEFLKKKKNFGKEINQELRDLGATRAIINLYWDKKARRFFKPSEYMEIVNKVKENPDYNTYTSPKELVDIYGQVLTKLNSLDYLKFLADVKFALLTK